jgi:broad specificity phosphatase PhoE
MTDLQCPARVVLARHGEAAASLAGQPRELTSRGRAQARGLAEGLAGERVAAIWSSTMLRAAQTAEVVAAHLGLPVTADDRLRELVGDEPWTPPAHLEDDPDEVYAAWLAGDLDGTIAGESGHDVVGRLRSVVEEVADRYRGECVLLVAHGGIIELGLLHLSHNVTAAFTDRHPLEPGAFAVVEVDSQGWTCTRWGDEVRSLSRRRS